MLVDCAGGASTCGRQPDLRLRCSLEYRVHDTVQREPEACARHGVFIFRTANRTPAYV